MAEAHRSKHGQLIDLTGKRFGKLVVIERAQDRPPGRTRWLCRCDCGTERDFPASKLMRNRISCGCARSEKRGGKSTAREYGIWSKMIRRCHNPKAHNYRYYGAKGVQVCDLWRGSYDAFEADMGQAPSLGHSLDRIDPFGNYEPGNVRWATQQQQKTNNRKQLRATHDGKTMLLKEWAKVTGIPYNTIYSRLAIHGWSDSEALTISDGRERTSSRKAR